MVGSRELHPLTQSTLRYDTELHRQTVEYLSLPKADLGVAPSTAIAAWLPNLLLFR
jgi:hypothetical protein